MPMEEKFTHDIDISATATDGQTQSAKSKFPLEVLPPKMQRIALELHSGCGFPLDYTASAMLAAISVAIGNTHRVEVKRNWQESAIVYMALVGRPGACKSHPLTFAMRPLVNADWKNDQEYQRQYSRYQQAIAMTKRSGLKQGSTHCRLSRSSADILSPT